MSKQECIREIADLNQINRCIESLNEVEGSVSNYCITVGKNLAVGKVNPSLDMLTCLRHASSRTNDVNFRFLKVYIDKPV